MIIKYLTDLVAFYPTTHQQDNVIFLLQYVQLHFEKHGLKTELININGVNSLYAHPMGKKQSKIMLQSHVDVVPTHLKAQETLIKDKDNLYGRGVFDMLFAVAAYMQFVETQSSKLANLDVSFLLTGDEELGGMNSTGKILDKGYSTQVCVLPDAGSAFGILTVAAKGVYHLNIQINGESHHGSRPWEGDGAAAKTIHFLSELQSYFDTTSHDESTLTIATINSGDAENRGPSLANVGLDIRYKDKADFARIKKILAELCKKYNGEILSAKDGDDYQLDLQNPHVETFIQLYEKNYDKPIMLEKAHGSSDARFFAEKNTPVVMFRPDGGNAHGDTEWVSRSSLKDFYSLLEQYVLEVAKIGDEDG